MGQLGGPGGRDIFKFGMNHVRYNIKLTTTTTSNQKSTTSNSMFELKNIVGEYLATCYTMMSKDKRL
jgi:hypothetical protein